MSFDFFGSSSRETNIFKDSFAFELPIVQERSRRIEERIIDTCPIKILDAPGLIDDYYLNLLDWTENRISIALGDTVYCYNVDTKEVNEIFSCNGYVSSIAGFSGHILAIGDSQGRITFFDMEESRIVDKRNYHNTRVSSISFTERSMSSGDKTGLINTVDLRSNTPVQLIGHTQEVCGLRWNPTGEYLASGSNDNTVRIWKNGSPISRILKGHESAVKAMDWCPWKTNVLATGGGSKDKSIRFWNVEDGVTVKKTEVSSQVCAIKYCNKYKEIISGHGFQENDLRLWKAGDMKLVSQFGTHESRILHMALSPDECTLVSLGADESLKFWKIAEKPAKQFKRDSIGFR